MISLDLLLDEISGNKPDDEEASSLIGSVSRYADLAWKDYVKGDIKGAIEELECVIEDAITAIYLFGGKIN